jgi:predicted RNase H-like HicB family nuclease
VVQIVKVKHLQYFYTARLTKRDSGFMGQIIEWPEVMTEGQSVEDGCDMLSDALYEMSLACRQVGRQIPFGY